MREAAIEAAATLLAKAWRSGETLAALPAAVRPRTVGEGYRVQAALASQLDLPLAGWKAGCTSAAGRKVLGARAPFAGPVFRSRIFASGSTLPTGTYRLRGVEGEFAFRLKSDLPPRRDRYTPEEVSAAIGQVYPAIEVVESRFADWLKVDLASIVADGASHGALILGAPFRAWRRHDLRRIPVRMRIDGEPAGEGSGADCMGSPILALAWLANHLRRRQGLRKGEIITTGTCCGFARAGEASRLKAEFGPAGQVDLRFAARARLKRNGHGL